MNTIDIEKLIIHYLIIYDGSYLHTKKQVEQEIVKSILAKKEQKNLIDCFDMIIDGLVFKKRIELITCTKMTDRQLHDYELNNDIFYSVINPL